MTDYKVKAMAIDSHPLDVCMKKKTKERTQYVCVGGDGLVMNPFTA